MPRLLLAPLCTWLDAAPGRRTAVAKAERREAFLATIRGAVLRERLIREGKIKLATEDTTIPEPVTTTPEPATDNPAERDSLVLLAELARTLGPEATHELVRLATRMLHGEPKPDNGH